MPARSLTGGAALAHGALAAGVKLASSYPGSPSSEVIETLTGLAEQHGIHVEWSTNEKVALELAIGASIAGRRAIVCTKSVGMNLMVDPLMALNLTPLHGGLVIVLGDDPGGYGSQNDQDTRSLAAMLEMPLLEPANPGEAYAMIQEAFHASERLGTPFIIRETRSFAQRAGTVEVAGAPSEQPNLGLRREAWRFVPVPRNVVAKHRELHDRMRSVAAWVDQQSANRIVGRGQFGIVAAGFAYQKLVDVLGDPPPEGSSVLKLSTLYPLPAGLCSQFVSRCREVLVVEENEPFVETYLKALAYDASSRTPILGKHSGHLPREGELFRWQIQQALGRFLPGFTPVRSYAQADEAKERPERENYCVGCRFGEVLDALEEACARAGETPVFVGDPGCLATVADRLHAKYAMGSAIGVADGMSKMGVSERPIALFGDSSFFHLALPAICNAVANRSTILMVVFDNSATVTTGLQPNPGVGRDALGRPAPRLGIERIARACGVEHAATVRHGGSTDPLREAFAAALAHRGLALVVVETPCKPPA